jgi:hypothetical protein
MTRHWTPAVAAMLVASATSVAGAQRKTLISRVGVVYHYLGDTIWMERDTTETRIIYHGDTIVRRMTIDGRLQNETTMVLANDSARVLSSRRPNGDLATPSGAQQMPRFAATAERDMLARELEMAPTIERAMSITGDPSAVPLSPASPITYPVSLTTTIVHARDTVRYIRGCPNVGRTDTTVFLLFGNDSTRRLTAPARTFGQAMAVGLIAQMHMSIVKQRIAGRTSDASRELPQIPDACRAK